MHLDLSHNCYGLDINMHTSVFNGSKELPFWNCDIWAANFCRKTADKSLFKVGNMKMSASDTLNTLGLMVYFVIQ